MTKVKTKKKYKRSFIATILVIAAVFSLFSVIFSARAKADSAKVDAAVDWAIATAEDDSHGYSQLNRYGNPDYDCSSFVLAAFRNAGFDLCEYGYTGSLKSQFMCIGFQWIPMSDINSTADLQKGDILLNEANHTEIYIGDNKVVGAKMAYGHPEGGDQTGREIAVTCYYNFPWDGVLRYTGHDTAINATLETSTNSSEALVGSFITLTAGAEGGSGSGYTYKFIVHNETTGEWYKIRDFAEANTAAWYTGPAGHKTLYVDVKDSDGAVVRKELDYYVVAAPLTVAGFSSLSGTNLYAYNSARLTAAAAGGSESYTYKFIVYNEETDQWYKIRDFGVGNTVVWNTGMRGSKQLFVDVKDNSGTVIRSSLPVNVR